MDDLRIEPAAAKARIDASLAIILDVGHYHPWEHLDRRISGAIRIEPDKIESQFRKVPRDKQAIAYCT